MSSQISQTPKWVSITEGAKYFSINPRTLRRLISKGDLPAYRVGARIIRINLNELDQAITRMQSVASQ